MAQRRRKPQRQYTAREKALLLEYVSRNRRKFSLEEFLFPEQLEFVRDQSNYATACCSRRAGKTLAAAAYLISEAIARPKVNCIYITLARSNAKKLIWPELLSINREYDLGGVPNETDLSLTFRNGSVVYCSGAKDKKEIEKFRGIGNLALAIIDECQSFASYIEDLIDDVISKALYDLNGKLRLLGTPGKVASGYFYKCCQVSSKWKNHQWTMHQNPWLLKKSGKTPDELIQIDLERTGLTLSSPRIRRECFGEWSTDLDSLVFQYRQELNHYEVLPSGHWSYVIGVDVGYEDSDAICVLGWTSNDPTVYLIEEHVKSKQGNDDLIQALLPIISKYKPLSVVMDSGGGGKKLMEDINKRYSLAIKPADKANKAGHIEVLNDALRTGRFKAKADSRFVADSLEVEWDKDKSTPDRLVISDHFHSDICDAVQYAYTRCLAYLAVPDPLPAPKYGTREYFEQEEQRMKARAAEQVRKNIQKQNTDGSLGSQEMPLTSLGSWDW